MTIDNDVLDYLGGEATAETMHAEFDGLTVEEIEHKLNEWFPGEDNIGLANRIAKYTI